MKRILEVGNCDPDHAAISEMISSNFAAEVVRVHGQTDALAELENGNFDLIMVNRLMDRDGSSGLDIIKRIKSSDVWTGTPMMMITNFDEHQQLAIDAGAVPGFGKSALNTEETLATLKAALAE